MAENYIVYERNKDDEDKRMWVVKYRDPVTKKFGSEKRIDALNFKLKNEKKHFGPNDEISANLVAERAYAAGLHSIKKGQDIGKVGLAGKKFIDFLYEYWDWEHSPYNIKAYLGKDYAATCMSMIRNHVEKQLNPNDLKCSQVSKSVITDLLETVAAKLSKDSYEALRNALKRPIGDLLEKEIIQNDPFAGMKTPKNYGKPSVPTGALDDEEMQRLMIQMRRHASDYYEIRVRHEIKTGTRAGKTHYQKRLMKLDQRVFLATALAGYSGPREGEIQALRVRSLKTPKKSIDDEIMIADISTNYARKGGYKLPKNGKARFAAVPKWLAEKLIELGKTNPWTDENGEKEDLIFYSDKVPHIPVDHKFLSDHYNEEVAFMLGQDLMVDEEKKNNPYQYYTEIMELGEAERRRRKIRFHSQRSLFTTISAVELGLENAGILTGHEDIGMVMHYFKKNMRVTQQLGSEIKKLIPNPFDDEENPGQNNREETATEVYAEKSFFDFGASSSAWTAYTVSTTEKNARST